jgi:primosomal protein N' (replication factor Y)
MPAMELSLFGLDAPGDTPSFAGAVKTVPVLLPLALEEPYSYAVPDGQELAPGTFVVVPLGPMKRIGAVWREAREPKPFDPKKLKAIVSVLEVPPLPPINLAFADWVANYTLAPKGMVLQMMMSARLVFEAEEPRWGFRLGGPAPARMTAARERVLATLADGKVWAKKRLLDAAQVSAAVIDGLAEAGALIRADCASARPTPRKWPIGEAGGGCGQLADHRKGGFARRCSTA